MRRFAGVAFGMPGFRITARSLEREGLSEEVLREFTDLETFAALEPEGLDLPAEKVVFVLEDEESVLESPVARRA